MALPKSNAVQREADELAVQLRAAGWLPADEYDAASAKNERVRKYRNCTHYYTHVPGPGPGGRAVAVLWCKLPHASTTYTPPPPALDAGPEPMHPWPTDRARADDNIVMRQVRQLANTLGINLQSDASKRALDQNSPAVQLAQLERIKDARERTAKAKPRAKGRRKKDPAKSTARDRRKKPRAKSALDDRRRARRAADATLDAKPLRRAADRAIKPAREPRTPRMPAPRAVATPARGAARAARPTSTTGDLTIDLTNLREDLARQLPERLQFPVPKFTLIQPAKGNTLPAITQRTLTAPINAIASSTASGVTNIINAVIRDQVVKALPRLIPTQAPAPVVEAVRTIVTQPAAAVIESIAPAGMHIQAVTTPGGGLATVYVPDIIPYSGDPLSYNSVGSALAELALTDPTQVGSAAWNFAASEHLFAAAGEQFAGASAFSAGLGAAEAFAMTDAAAATLSGLAWAEGAAVAAPTLAAGAGIEAALAAIPGWGWAAAAALFLLGSGILGDRGPKPQQVGIIDAGGGPHFSQNNYLQGVDDLYQELDANLFAAGVYNAALAAPYLGYGSPTGTFAQTIAAILARIEPARVKPFPAAWFAGWVARADARTAPIENLLAHALVGDGP